MRLNRHDPRELAGLPDKELCARVRQISARANRVKLYPHQKSILETLMGGKGFHSGGFVSTPTGRRPSEPEMQFPSGTRTGRWSSTMPQKSQEPRPNKVEVRILDESHYLKPGLVGIDFAEIEKRVMAQMGTDPDKMGGRFYTAEVQARQAGKRAKLALELWRQANANLVGFWLHHALKAAVDKAMKDIQTQVDEEGCGAAFAALKEWK